MSISLNNHEDRIKVLENRRPKWIPLTTKSTNISYTNWVKICDFDTQMYQFGMIAVDNAYNPDTGNNSNIHLNFLPLATHQFEFVAWNLDPLVSKDEHMMIRVQSGSVYGKTIADSPQDDNYAVFCWGLKLYYNFSYNIYCLIYAFLESLFEEV